MKAMVLDHPARIEGAPLRLLDVPRPEPGPGEVRVRVRCCAMCRTDLHVIEGELPRAKMPIIPGHQAVGEVEAIGPGCRIRRIGERVGVAWLRHTCGSCGFCVSSRENLCESSRFTGYHADGGYAEFLVAPEAFTYPIPDRFDDVSAAPLLCAGIIGYRALARSNVKPGGRLALFGFGSSAHVVLQIARHRSCEVVVVTRGEEHRKLAAEMGAAWVGETAAGLAGLVDGAIIFAPAGELVPPALRILKKGGTLAIAGIHLSDIPVMNYQDCLFFERDLRTVTANTRENGRRLLEEAAAIPLRPETTVYPLKDANRGLQDLKGDGIRGTGVLAIS